MIEELDSERLAEAIWNAISGLPHLEHERGDCEFCDVRREVINADAAEIAAEYVKLLPRMSRGAADAMNERLG